MESVRLVGTPKNRSDEGERVVGGRAGRTVRKKQNPDHSPVWQSGQPVTEHQNEKGGSSQGIQKKANLKERAHSWRGRDPGWVKKSTWGGEKSTRDGKKST
jgi:hypothetical protein